MMEEEQGMIPALPEDVALDCLARVPHRFLPRIRPVCRKWRDLVAAPAFLRRRRALGAAEDLVFLVQALKEEEKEKDAPAAGAAVGSAEDLEVVGESKEELTAAYLRPPVYTVSLYNATLDTWHRIPAPEPVPMFSQCVVVDNKLFLVGGWDPATLDPVADTQILDLTTMTWRRGAPMATARSFFACAAVGGMVYVAGGHDAQKNALRSAEAYDAAADRWVSLPPMSEERDEAKGLVLGGEFWAVSGYSTESQGRFATSAERYDPNSGVWSLVEDAWDDATCASCFALGGAAMGAVDSRGAREFVPGEGWRAVGPAPEGMRSSTCGAVVGGGEKVLVAGGEGNGCWVLDLKTRKWARVEAPAGFSGFVFSAASVRV